MPVNAALSKVIQTGDGGYLLAGTLDGGFGLVGTRLEGVIPSGSMIPQPTITGFF